MNNPVDIIYRYYELYYTYKQPRVKRADINKILLTLSVPDILPQLHGVHDPLLGVERVRRVQQDVHALPALRQPLLRLLTHITRIFINSFADFLYIGNLFFFIFYLILIDFLPIV